MVGHILLSGGSVSEEVVEVDEHRHFGSQVGQLQ